MGILSLLLWTPAAGVLLLVFIPSQNTHAIRTLANIATAFAFLLSCGLVSLYDPHNASLQFSEYFPLNPNLGSTYALGIDGLSLPMLVLATLLTSIALLASFTISSSVKGYHICILLLEFGMLGNSQ